MAAHRIEEGALAQIFLEARTYDSFRDEPVPDELLREAWNLARLGPTSANGMPARILFVKSPAGKKRLEPTLSDGNRAKTMKAPVTAIVAYDLEFYEHLPKLFAHTDARSWFVGKQQAIQTTAFRNGTLLAAYFIVAARAVGLDCGPMSGFDNAKVDEEFFSGMSWRSNFLCNLGFGDPHDLHPRHPRLEFDEACKII
ncbi:MAG: malonic semialdehyde reductase [Rhodospirillaceae bacterium]|nr:malonic semialdehyde reductase [Rhodospirillaceae bacterium]